MRRMRSSAPVWLAVGLALLVLLASPTGGAAAGAAALPRCSRPVVGPILRIPVIPEPRWQPGHRGLDLQAEVGSSVHSPITGTVVWVGTIAGVPSMTIEADGLRHSLLPVEASVIEGDELFRGDVVGLVADGDHCGWQSCVHWGIKRNGHYLDPRWCAGVAVYRLNPRR